MQVTNTAVTMQESLRHLRNAKRDRRKAAQAKAVTFVTGVGLVAGGAGLTATGVGKKCHISPHTFRHISPVTSPLAIHVRMQSTSMQRIIA